MNRIYRFQNLIETKYLPKNYEFANIYICKQSKSVRFLCPNKNCKKLVILPLQQGDYDSWKITSGKKWFKKRESITLYPSIWSKTHHDKCHYWIKNNKITWVENKWY